MPIRETFWNIPHYAEIGQYLLGLLSLCIFAVGVYRRVRRWRMGQLERRSDRMGERLRSVVVDAIGQVRILQDPFPGVMHLAIFWGMAALFIGTILATVDWDVTHLIFGFQFLRGLGYLLYELVLDILGLMLLFGLGMAAYRRYILRPPRLDKVSVRHFAWDDAYVLAVLGIIVVTGYLVEGLRIAVLQPDWARWSPIGAALGSVFLATGDPTNRTLHLALWITHGLVAFIFISSIPLTKFFHIVTAPLNIYFRSLQPAGRLSPAHHSSGPGVMLWRDFTWKQLLDFDACVRCGRCQDHCPATASGLSLSPRDLIIKLGIHFRERSNGGKLHGDVIPAKDLWACTTCRACTQACPIFVDHISTIVDLRRHLVYEGLMNGMLQETLERLARYGNSFGQSPRMRARWTQSSQTKVKDARKEAVEYLWFVGDYASYHNNLTEVTCKTAEVFQQANLDFGILYEAEYNAGNDVRRVGEEGLFEMLVEKNSASLGRCDFNAIITTDPHSYNTLINEYPTNGNSRQVWHSSEVMDRILSRGQLKLSKKLDYIVTYHDPCYLGRYNKVYSAPRRVIAATGCKLVEMPRHGDQALCCGAGGGRIWVEEEPVKERPSEARVREAAGLMGVQVLVVACPKDVAMFQDALKTTGLEDRLLVKDLIELVHEAI